MTISYFLGFLAKNIKHYHGNQLYYPLRKLYTLAVSLSLTLICCGGGCLLDPTAHPSHLVAVPQLSRGWSHIASVQGNQMSCFSRHVLFLALCLGKKNFIVRLFLMSRYHVNLLEINKLHGTVLNLIISCIVFNHMKAFNFHIVMSYILDGLFLWLWHMVTLLWGLKPSWAGR